jgi:5-oxoprolinase (ATP-hydrolysing)
VQCVASRLLLMAKRLRHSSILSAYGLALADRVFERQEPASSTLSEDSLPHLQSRWDALSAEVTSELRHQGFKDERIHLEVYLNCRFDGTVSLLQVFAIPGPLTS